MLGVMLLVLAVLGTVAVVASGVHLASSARSAREPFVPPVWGEIELDDGTPVMVLAWEVPVSE